MTYHDLFPYRRCWPSSANGGEARGFGSRPGQVLDAMGDEEEIEELFKADPLQEGPHLSWTV